MKLVCRNNASILLCGRKYLSCSSVTLPKRWESGSREIDTVKVARKASVFASPSRSKFNLVGPRDYNSNIRKIIFAKLSNESTKEKYFREQQQELNTWHQDFWGKQNEKFNKSKRAFLQLRPRNLEMDTSKEFADDLSTFYRDFLDGNHKVHSQYLRDWYSRNFHLLWTGIQISVSKIFSKIMPKRSR